MSAPLSLVCENLISTLIARRHELGLTQTEVAQRMGVTQTEVGRWECGMFSPTLGSLVNWCVALDLFVRFIPFEGRARKEARTRPLRKLKSRPRATAHRLPDVGMFDQPSTSAARRTHETATKVAVSRGLRKKLSTTSIHLTGVSTL